MPTIAELRDTDPDLAGLDDDTVVDVVHQAYYPDLPREDVAKALGYKPPPPPPPERTLMGTVGDAALSVGKGIIGVPEAAVGLADIPTGGRVGKFLENEDGIVGFRPKQAKGMLDEGLSDAQKAANKQVMDAEGLWETVKAAVRNPSVAGMSVLESLPLMLGGGLVGRGVAAAGRGQIGAGMAAAVGEGTVMAGGAAESIRQQTPDGLLTGEQAGIAGATGAAGAAFGMLGVKIAHSLGLKDIDELIVAGATNARAQKHIVRKVLEGWVSEGLLEEVPQSISEQVLENLALGRALDEGVNQAGVLGFFAGGLMGSAAQVLPSGSRRPPAPAPAPRPAPVAKPTPADVLAAPDVDTAIATALKASGVPAGMIGPSLTGADPGALPGMAGAGGANAALLAGAREREAAVPSVDDLFPLPAASVPADDVMPPAIPVSRASPQDRAIYEELTRETNPDVTGGAGRAAAAAGQQNPAGLAGMVGPAPELAGAGREQAGLVPGRGAEPVRAGEPAGVPAAGAGGATGVAAGEVGVDAGRPVQGDGPGSGLAESSVLTPQQLALQLARAIAAVGEAEGKQKAKDSPDNRAYLEDARRVEQQVRQQMEGARAADAAAWERYEREQEAVAALGVGDRVQTPEGPGTIERKFPRNWRVRVDGVGRRTLPPGALIPLETTNAPAAQADAPAVPGPAGRAEVPAPAAAPSARADRDDPAPATRAGSDGAGGQEALNAPPPEATAAPAPAAADASAAPASPPVQPDAPADGAGGEDAVQPGDARPAAVAAGFRDPTPQERESHGAVAALDLPGATILIDRDRSNGAYVAIDGAVRWVIRKGDKRSNVLHRHNPGDWPATIPQALREPLLAYVDAAAAAPLTQREETPALAAAREALMEAAEAAQRPAAAGPIERAAGIEPGRAAPLYAQRKVENAAAILAWAKSQGFTDLEPADKLHVTIAFSRQPVDPGKVGNTSPAYDKGRVTGTAGRKVARLGDEGAIVLHFDSPVLTSRWQQFRKAGASWDFEGYQPHITISYGDKGLDLSKVKPYTGAIELGPELQEPLDAEPENKPAAEQEPVRVEPSSSAPAENNADPSWWDAGKRVPSEHAALEEASEDAAFVLEDEDLALEWRIAQVPVSSINAPDTAPGGEEDGARRMADIKAAPALSRPIYELLPDGRLKIIDGWHRLQVAKERGQKTIEALVGRRQPATAAQPRDPESGQFVAEEKPSEKKKRAGNPDRKLRQAWPVDAIDGYQEMPGQKAEQTDFGLKNGVKDAFLQDARSYLRAVADELLAYGFRPPLDAKNRVMVPVRINQGGPAVAGDVYLDMRGPTDADGDLRIQVGASHREPNRASILLQRLRGNTFVGGNQFPSSSATAGELAAMVAKQWGITDRAADAPKPVTPQVPNEPGTKYVLPSFVTGGKAAGAPSPKPEPSKNTIVTDDMAAAARARLKAKLSRLGSGIDPEMLLDGVTLAAYHVEKGARTFAAYAKAMLEDLGEAARPYLKSWYMGAKYDPRYASIAEGMSSAGFVDEFDVSTLTAPQPEQNGGQDGTARNLDRNGEGESQGEPPADVRAADGQRGAGELPGGAGAGRERADAAPAGRGADLGRGMGAGGADAAAAAGARGDAADAGDGRVQGAPRADAGPVERPDAGREAGPGGVAPNAAPAPAPQFKPADFTIEDDFALGEGGAKTKFRANVEAIRIVKQLQADPERLATPDEQQALAKYVGWGGLAQAFDASKADWQREFAELKALLTDEEYEAARRSTRYAHYTSREVVQDGIYAALAHFGFTGGRVLEPGAGVGNFIGLMPAGMRTAGRVTAIERDPISATIARALYPQQNVQLADFTEFRGNDGFFDAVVGNPPFASDPQTDASGRKHLSGLNLHSYFFAKSVDMLREGGILAQVVTNYFLDAKGDRARRYIADRTKFLGAIRLPNNAFSKNAGTEVTTDIIFLQKRPEAEWGSKAAREDAKQWLDSRPYQGRRGESVPLNDYFHAHPEMMLGEFGPFGTMYRQGSPALVARDGQDTRALLKEAVQRLPAAVYTSIAETASANAAEAAAVALKNPTVQEGGYFLQDGALMQRLPDIAGEARSIPITPATQWTEKTQLGERRFGHLKALAEMRQTLRDLLAAELTGDAKMDGLRTTLNQQYDAYTKEYGLLGDRTTHAVFDDDPDFPLLLSLESDYTPGVGPAEAKRLGVKPTKSTAKKSAIFSRKVVEQRKAVTRVDSLEDALNVSMAERGRLDAAYMAKLLGRDDAEDMLKEMTSGERPLLFLDPASNEYVLRDAYLSGNVRQKLEQAKAAAMTANARALEAVQPEDVPAHQISAKVGAPWVPTSVYEDFAKELLGEGTKASITYLKLTSSYGVYVTPGSEVNNSNKWGTPSYSAVELLAALLNNRTIKVQYKDIDGKVVTDAEKTEMALAKAQELKDKFNDWLMSEPERSQLLVRAYNDANNNYVTRQYDGSWLTFPGKVPDMKKPGDGGITFRRHQRNAIARSVQERTVLYDHVVGAGKTFTAVAAVMEMRRTGLANKPMIAVPNHLVKQWAADFYRLYPGAKILAATKKDFEKVNRRRFLAKIATGDWDAIVIAHSSFGFIQPGADFEAAFNEKQVKLIEAAIKDVEESVDDPRQVKRTVKQLEGMVERLENRIKRLRDKPMDNLLDFEELGVDQLVVDEAHLFKNLMYQTKLQNVAGMGDPAGSKRAYDMYVKTQQIMQRNGRGQGVIFATGTPVSNSLAEKYHMMRFLMPRQMEELGFESFDAWANTYADVRQHWMQKVSGDGFKSQNRMSEFVNVIELLKLFDQVADTVTNDDIKKAYKEETGKEYPLPTTPDGKPRKPVSLDKSPAQTAYMTELATRAAIVEARKGPPQKGEDNHLSLMTDARKAAMDIRLVDMDATEREKGGRIDRSADEIVARYQKWAHVKGTQLVFSDLGTPKKHAAQELKEFQRLQAIIAEATDEIRDRAALGDERAQEVINAAEDAERQLDEQGPDWLTAVKAALRGFSVYDDLKDALVERGIPAEQIAFIHDYNTDEQKAALFRKVNAGDIRVLMGSTPKMGAGTNVQQRLVALHHLDVPWKPSDVEQREGRIVRQGNLLLEQVPGFNVEILAYVTKDTLDMRMWQIQEVKLKIIHQLRTRQIERNIENAFEDMEMSASEMQAAATGNMDLLYEIQARNDIKKLEQKKRSFEAQKNDLIGRRTQVAKRLKELPARIEHERRLEALSKQYQQALTDGQQAFKVTIDGKEFTEFREASNYLLGKTEAKLYSRTVEKDGKKVREEMSPEEYAPLKARYDALYDARVAAKKDGKDDDGNTKELDAAHALIQGFEAKAAPLDITMNGVQYTARAKLAEAFSNITGDREPVRWEFNGATFNRRAAAATAIRQLVTDAIADEKEATIGTLGPWTVKIEGQPEDRFKRRALEVVLAGPEGLSVDGYITLDEDDLKNPLKVAEQVVGWAARKAPDAGQPYYLERDLEVAKRQQADLDKAEDLGEWPDMPKLEEARAKHAEILKRLAGAKGAKPLQDSRERPEFSQGGAFFQGDVTSMRRHVGELQQAIDSITDDWALAPPVTVVSTIESPSVPMAIRVEAAQRVRSGGGTPRGVIYGGHVFLFADRLQKPADAATVLLHEVAGHWGLRKRFGPELDAILDQIATLRKADVEAMIQRTGMDPADPASTHRAVEEILAYMAQEQPTLGFVRRAVAAIRAWLRDTFPVFFGDMNLTDDEIVQQFIIPARHYVEGGPDGGPGGGQDAAAFSQKRYSDETKAEAVRRYAQGERAAEIASDMELRLPALYEWLKKAGVPLRGVESTRAVDAAARAEIVQRYQAGESTVQLAGAYGVHAATIASYLKAAGVDRRQSGPTDDMVAEAKRLYESGLSLEKVADQLGSSGTAVLQWLRKAGIETRPRAGHPTELKDEAVRLYAEGMSTIAIAERLGVNPVSAYEWVKAAGALRSKSEATAVALQNGRPVYSGINTPWQSTKTGQWEMANSTYELLRMAQLDEDAEVVRWSKKTPLVEYEDADGKPRIYVPDFIIEYADGRRVVEEVKPEFLLKAPLVVRKHDAARKVLGEQGIDFRVVTQHDIGVDAIKEAYRHMRAQKAKSDAEREADDQLPLFSQAQGFNTRQIQVDGKWRPIDNADGELIHPTFQGQAEFWRRFADQFPLDEQGRPQVSPGEVHGLLSGFTPMFSQDMPLNDPRSYWNLSREWVDELGKTPGKLHWWHKTLGTQYNLAQKNPAYKRVFDRVQDFLQDVSLYATEAADRAPQILPQLDSWRDIVPKFMGGSGKAPISAADNKAIRDPIIQGTLEWTRDKFGNPIRVDDAREAATTMTADEKLDQMVRNNQLSPNVAKMWKGLPYEQFTAMVETRYENTALKAGIVWTDTEMRRIFNLTDGQIALYRQFRAATDESITRMALSGMVRMAGKDADFIRQEVMQAKSVAEGKDMLVEQLKQTAATDTGRAGTLQKLSDDIEEAARKALELMDRGYAPLMRFGHHTVTAYGKNEDGVEEVKFFGMYESPLQARLAAKRLEEQFAEDNEPVRIARGTMNEEGYKLFAGVNPETAELFGEMLGLDALGDSKADQAFQAWLKLAKASRSAMKRMIHRKGTAGFSEDMGRVLAAFIYSNARQTSRALHTGEIDEAVRDIDPSKTGQGELQRQATRLAEYVNNPVEEAHQLRGLLFAQYLGGSIAAALVNMTQPFQVTMPYLSQFGGIQASAKRMGWALTHAWAPSTGDAAMDRDLKRAVDEGVVAPQEVHQLMAQAQGAGSLRSGDGTRVGNMLAGGANLANRIMAGWGKPFATAELFNRRVTFVAAYKTAQEQGIANPFEFAKQAVIETQFLYNKGNRPEWSRGALGATLMTFKQYSISYLELMERMWTAGEPGSPERAAGRRAVFFAAAMVLMLAGAGGFPFVEDVEDVIDGIMQRLGYNWQSKQKVRELLEGAFGKAFGGFLEKGVSGLPGAPIDVAGRLGLGNLIPGTGALQKKEDRSRDVLDVVGPTGDLAKRVAAGLDMAASGDVIRGGLEMSPKAIRDLRQAIDMMLTGQYRTARSYDQMPVTGGDAVAKAIGFQPGPVAKKAQGDRAAQAMASLARLRENEIAGKWAKGFAENDASLKAEARAELQDWNEKNPATPIKIKMQSVLRRAQKMRQTRAERIAQSAPREVRQEARRMMQDE